MANSDYKIYNDADLQWYITSVIMQKKEKFDYNSIYNEIKNDLRGKKVPEEIVSSFKLENMINNALDNLVYHEVLFRFKNQYVPVTAKMYAIV
ncbi:MAG: hypothetical protein GX757_08485 [Clostridiales bacterium]|nr:hypothetical protein [Clostridiales bacterium]